MSDCPRSGSRDWDGEPVATSPSIPYWHMWTDADGVSQQERRSVDGMRLRQVADGADPVWVAAPVEGTRRVVLAVLPVGLVGEWHENPVPQWIVVLSGRWFVETMDGTRVEMGPGDLSFGGDQGTRAVDGRRGHRSGALGDQPTALMMVQFGDGTDTTEAR